MGPLFVILFWAFVVLLLLGLHLAVRGLSKRILVPALIRDAVPAVIFIFVIVAVLLGVLSLINLTMKSQ